MMPQELMTIMKRCSTKDLTGSTIDEGKTGLARELARMNLTLILIHSGTGKQIY